MKVIIVPALALLLTVPLINGCRKRKTIETAAPAAPRASEAAPTATVQPVGAAAEGAVGRGAEPPPVSYHVDASVRQALSKFYNTHERPAMTWEELVRGKYIPAVPLGPDGKPLDWNTTMQRIGKSAARPW